MKRIVRVFAITLIAIMLSAVAVHAADSYFELDGFAFDFSEQGEELLLAGVPATVKGRATYALKNVSTR